jgi:hypothetical protein
MVLSDKALGGIMKRLRPTYFLFATALVLAVLQQSGNVAAGGPGLALSLLSGSYASLFSGTTSGGSPVPFAGTGIFISDGHGKLSGHETINLNGTVCSFKLNGTYTLTADGSGTNAINFFDGGPGCAAGSYSQSLAVADGGDLIVLSNTNPGDVASEQWHRTRSFSP